MPKTTAVEREQQLTVVMQWLVEGYSRGEIIQKAQEVWDCGIRKVDDMIAQSRQQFVDNVAKIDRRQIVAEAIERYDYLYKKGVEQRQLAVSIAAQQAKMKMIGADAPAKQ
jgi:hypothetical protein